MNEAAIRKKVVEVTEALTASPFLGHVLKGSPQGLYHAAPQAEDAPIEAHLDQLRLQVKYLLFDLEATRRENRYLRQMLETRHKRDLDDLRGDGPGGP